MSDLDRQDKIGYKDGMGIDNFDLNMRRTKDLSNGFSIHRVTLWIAVGILSIICLYLIYLLSESSKEIKVVPYVITIEDSGRAQRRGVIGKQYQSFDNVQWPEKTINFYIRTFIDAIRSVSTDINIIESNINIARYMVTQSVHKQLEEMLINNDPFQRAKHERVIVDIYHLLPYGDNWFSLEWKETIYPNSSARPKEEFYKANLRIYFSEPNTLQELTNPIGLFVSVLKIEQIKIQ